ncbi:MAG: DUF4265 domain-containing protein [Chloroflexota bacterium]
MATHREPVWRDASDFLILVDLQAHDLPGHWEQLWVRRLQDETFQLCCIPFYTYGLSLGDIVEATSDDGGAVVLRRLVRASGHRTVRAALRRNAPEPVHSALHEIVSDLGVPHEWKAGGFVAIDAADRRVVDLVRERLSPLEVGGLIEVEVG